jgi:hypothetical protein
MVVHCHHLFFSIARCTRCALARSRSPGRPFFPALHRAGGLAATYLPFKPESYGCLPYENVIVVRACICICICICICSGLRSPLGFSGTRWSHGSNLRSKVGWGPISRLHGHRYQLQCHSSLHLPLPTLPTLSFTSTIRRPLISFYLRFMVCHYSMQALR